MSNTTSTKATASATEEAPVETQGTGYIKPKGHNEDKDWTYLVDKDPNETNVLYAKMVTELSGVEISPKQVQALLSMHRWMQASDLNRARENFRGRTWEEVRRGNATLLERSENIITERGEDAPVVESPNVTSDELKQVTAAALAEVRAMAAQAPALDDAAKLAHQAEELTELVEKLDGDLVEEEAPKEEAPKTQQRKARTPRKTAAQKKAEAEAAAQAEA